MLVPLALLSIVSSARASAQEPKARKQEITIGVMPMHQARGLVDGRIGPRRGGFAVELAREAAEAIGLKVNEVAVEDDDLAMSLLRDGSIDVIVPLSITGERLTHVAYTAPIIICPGAAFVRKGDRPMRDVDDLRGRRIVVTLSGVGHEWCLRNGLDFDIAGNLITGLNAVSSGDADCLITLQIAGRAEAELHRRDEWDDYPLEDLSLYRAFALAVRPDDASLVADLNTGLTLLVEKGRRDELYERWVARYQPSSAPRRVSLETLWWIFTAVAVVLLCAFASVRWLRNELRKRTAELAQSEARYQVITDNLPALVTSVLLEPDGRLQRRYASPHVQAWKAQFPSIQPGSIGGAELLADVHPDDRASVEAETARARATGGRFDCEFRLRAASGDYRWLHATYSSMAAQGGVLWNGMIVDTTPLRAAEEALRASEAKYRGIFEASRDAILLVRPSDRIVLEANERACELYGYGRDELVGLSLQRISTDVDASASVIASTLEQGQLAPLVMRHARKDGRTIDVEIAASVVTLGGVELLLSVNRDVTERSRIEAALRTSEERYRAFVTHSSEAVWCFELDRPMPIDWEIERQIAHVFDHGWLAECNDVMAQMYGLARAEDAIGTRLHQMLLRDDPNNWEYLRAFVAAGYRLNHAESHEVDANGQHRYFTNNLVGVVEQGCVVRAWGTQLDVTERRAAERALVESERRLRAVIDHAPNVAIQGFDAAGRVLFWNPAAERLTGVTERDAVGRELADLALDATLLADLRAALAQVALGGEPTVTRERELVLPDGCSSWIYTTIFPIPGVDGGTQYIAFAVDVTARVLESERRRKLDEELRHVQKLESLGVLAGGIAHDFNNILAAIIGNAELAVETLDPSTDAWRSIGLIEQAAQRGADLTRQMLAYTGRTTRTIEVVDFSALVREMAELIEVSISKRAELSYDLSPSLPPIEIDSTQIRQVVMNVLTNAADAIDARTGVISIRTFETELGENDLRSTFAAQSATPGRFVALEVRDNGCGIPAELIAKIFEPFYTTKFQGRGLGLSAALGIVHSHRGAIEVRSEVDAGTQIRIYLPAATGSLANRRQGLHGPAAVAPAARRRTSAEAAAHGSAAFVIDDEPMVREVICEVIAQESFTPRAFADGAVAVAAFSSERDDVAFAVVDMVMPRMDGAETVRELRALAPDLPVLMVSGHVDPAGTEELRHEPRTAFLHKPFTPRQLKAAVRELLALQGEPRSRTI